METKIMETKIHAGNIKQFEFSFEEVDRLWEDDLKSMREKKFIKAKEYEKKKNELLMQKKIRKLQNELNGKEVESEAEDDGPAKVSKKFTDEELKNTKLYDYVERLTFPVDNTDGVFIVEHGKLCFKTDAWKKYADKIKMKDSRLFDLAMKDRKGLYHVDVFDESFFIDTEKRRVNLAKQRPFIYDPNAKVNKEKAEALLNFVRDVICSKDEAIYLCLMQTLACMAQMKMSQVIVFLQGLGGIGKSFFCENIIKGLLGDSCQTVPESVLSGEDPFNSALIGASAVVLEETAGTMNYQRLMKEMKSNCTGDTINARYMYASSYPVKNLMNIIILSNHFRDIDCGDRRVLMPPISNEHQNDQGYFEALQKNVCIESLQYIYNMLHIMELPARIKIPDTVAKQEFKESNMSSCLKYVIEEFMVKGPGEKHEKKMVDVYNGYVLWCEKTNVKQVAKKDFFSSTVRNYTQRVKNADGSFKDRNGNHLYDFSYGCLNDFIVKRSKVLTEEQLKEWQDEFANKKDKAEDAVVDDKEKNELMRKNEILRNDKEVKQKEIDDLNEKYIREKEQVKQLMEKLANLEKELEKEKESKTEKQNVVSKSRKHKERKIFDASKIKSVVDELKLYLD